MIQAEKNKGGFDMASAFIKIVSVDHKENDLKVATFELYGSMDNWSKNVNPICMVKLNSKGLVLIEQLDKVRQMVFNVDDLSWCFNQLCAHVRILNNFKGGSK